MDTMAKRLELLKRLVTIAAWLSGFILTVLMLSEAMILKWLPEQPDPALIGLLQTIQTGLVYALGVMTGGLGTGMLTYFSFRSAKETSGDETPAAP